MRRISKISLFITAFVAVAFMIQSCNSVKPIDKTELEGYWVLKTLQGEEAKVGFPIQIPSVEFNFADSTVFGNSGCNTYMGLFTLTAKNEFTAANLASTLMLCIEDTKEPQFLAALSTPNLTVSVKDGMLEFKQADKVLLQFVKGEKKTAAVALTADMLAGEWTLASIAGGELAALFGENIPTLAVATDGTVSGNSGCNNYRSSFTLSGDSISFGPVMSTKMACPNLKGEDLFTSLLVAPLQASMNGDKLTFVKDGNTVLSFVRK